jgi:hypothetical protein
MANRVASLALVVVAACATSADTGPSADELDDLDQWSQAADGKADLPATWDATVAWVRDFYTNKMSAVWDGQEHPANSDAALVRIHSLLGARGIAAENVKFSTTVRRLHAQLIDHSEIDVDLPGGGTVRLVGDPKGAGVFFDDAAFQEQIGPALCLTWSELQTAVETSYIGGAYATDYVCHTVTERVLRALRVGSSVYANQVHTYAVARWIWGPIIPSGSSQDPTSWPESRSCQ